MIGLAVNHAIVTVKVTHQLLQCVPKYADSPSKNCGHVKTKSSYHATSHNTQRY